MRASDIKKLFLVSFISIFLGALTVAIVYFVSSRQAPSAPTSKPRAAGVCYLGFFFPSPTPACTPPPACLFVQPHPCLPPVPPGGWCIVTPTITPGPSLTPTQTPTITPSPTITLTPTPGPSSTPTSTPTLTPSPTSPPGVCYSQCTTDSDCQSGQICSEISGVKRCVNSNCPYSSSCTCTSPTSTPTPVTQTQIQATPTIVTLQEAGVSTPTWTAVAGGSFLILLGALFFVL